MSNNLQHMIILAGAFLVLFIVAEILYHRLHVKAEITRKIVHIGTGLLTLLFPVLLSSHWWVLLLCGSFFLLLVLSMRYHLLKSIHAIDRRSVGSLVYPVIVYGCFLAWEKIEKPIQPGYSFFYVPILVMALADPAAALTGKSWPKGVFKIGNERKSLSGSSAFFIVALIVACCFFYFSSGYSFERSFTDAILIALISAVVEAVSRNGFDNLTIPVSVLACMYFFMII